MSSGNFQKAFLNNFTIFITLKENKIILHQKRKGNKEKDDGKASRKTRCLIEGHPCLVAFVYESDNNIVSQRVVEKVQLPTSFHLNQARIKFST